MFLVSKLLWHLFKSFLAKWYVGLRSPILQQVYFQTTIKVRKEDALKHVCGFENIDFYQLLYFSWPRLHNSLCGRNYRRNTSY